MLLLPSCNEHLKVLGPCTLSLSFLNARGETRAMHPKQTASRKLPFEMVVPPLSHFALKTETAKFSRNVENPGRHDKPQMWILATNRCALLATTTDCSTVCKRCRRERRPLLWGKLRVVKDSVTRITSSRKKINVLYFYLSCELSIETNLTWPF